MSSDESEFSSLSSVSDFSDSESDEFDFDDFDEYERRAQARHRSHRHRHQRDEYEYDDADVESEEEEPAPEITVESVKRNTAKIQEVCVVCTESFCKSNTTAAYLPCSHWYHFSCVSKWLQLKNTCPQCLIVVDTVYRNDG
jgi:hypothetical protein